MSDLMLLGVLRMPMPDNPADLGVLEWAQVKDRMRQAADELENRTAKLAVERERAGYFEFERDQAWRRRDELSAAHTRAIERAEHAESDRDALRAELAAVIEECARHLEEDGAEFAARSIRALAKEDAP